MSKCYESHDYEYCAYQKQEYSPSPRATNHIHKGKVDNYERNHNAETPEKYPSYIFKIFAHIFTSTNLGNRIIKRLTTTYKQNVKKIELTRLGITFYTLLARYVWRK